MRPAGDARVLLLGAVELQPLRAPASLAASALPPAAAAAAAAGKPLLLRARVAPSPSPSPPPAPHLPARSLRRRFDPREVARLQERRAELARAAAEGLRDEFAAGGTCEWAAGAAAWACRRHGWAQPLPAGRCGCRPGAAALHSTACLLSPARQPSCSQPAVAEEEESEPGPDGYTERSEREREERDGGAAPAGDVPPPPPPLAWRPAQLAADLSLAKRLMAALDREKGIAANPLAPPPPEPAAGAADGGDGGDTQPAAAGEGADGEAAEQQQQEQQQQQAQQQAEDMDAELSPEEAAAKLDQVGARRAGGRCLGASTAAEACSCCCRCRCRCMLCRQALLLQCAPARCAAGCAAGHAS